MIWCNVGEGREGAGGGHKLAGLTWETTLIWVTFKSLTCHQYYRTGNGQEYRQVNLITI